MRAMALSVPGTLSTAISVVGSRPARVAEIRSPPGLSTEMSSSRSSPSLAVTTTPDRQTKPLEFTRPRPETASKCGAYCTMIPAKCLERTAKGFSVDRSDIGASRSVGLICHRTNRNPTGRVARSKKSISARPAPQMLDSSATLFADDLGDAACGGIDQDHLVLDHRVAITPDRRYLDGVRHREQLDARGHLDADARPEVHRRRHHDPLAGHRAKDGRALVRREVDHRGLGRGDSRRAGQEDGRERTLHE